MYPPSPSLPHIPSRHHLPASLPLISTRRRRQRSARPARQGGRGKWHREGSNQISLMKCILAEVASVSAERSCLCASLLRRCVTVMESPLNAANETVTLTGLRFSFVLFVYVTRAHHVTEIISVRQLCTYLLPPLVAACRITPEKLYFPLVYPVLSTE